MWAAVYKADPAELKIQLDGFFTAPNGPGLPNGENSAATPKAIVAPHIDFHRGGPAYAWAYKGLAESDGADLFILLGTSHCGGRTPFILTLKDFETPLGLVETDKEFVDALAGGCGDDLFCRRISAPRRALAGISGAVPQIRRAKARRIGGRARAAV